MQPRYRQCPPKRKDGSASSPRVAQKSVPDGASAKTFQEAIEDKWFKGSPAFRMSLSIALPGDGSVMVGVAPRSKAADLGA